MKERMEVLDFKYKVVFLTFLFFLIISTLSPLSGIDLASYNAGKEGLKFIITNLNSTDGKIISNILVGLLSYHKPLFNLALSILMASFVLNCNNLLGIVKNKYFYLVPFIGTLLVSSFLFSYNYMSVTASLTYTFPAILIFNYFVYLWKKENYTFSLPEILLLTFKALFIVLCSPFMGITFLFGNILFYLYSLKNKKKISKKYLFNIAISFIALIISLTNIDGLFLYKNIDANMISKYIDVTFSKNIVLLIAAIIPINLYLLKRFENNIYKRVIVTLFDTVLIFSLTYNFFYYSPVNLNLILSKYFGVFATENWYYIFYFILYLALLALSINYYVKSKKTKNYLLLFLFISVLNGLFMLISPLWDEGNSILFVFSLIAIISVLIKEIEIKLYPKVTTIFTALFIIYYISMFSLIKYIDKTRDEYVREQLNANQINIEVKASPIYLVWRYNPVNIFQQRDFKNYYEISDETSIEVKYFGIFEKIEKKVKD